MSQTKDYVRTTTITFAKRQTLRKYKLTEVKDYHDNLNEVMDDEKSIREVCSAIFEGDFKDVDINDIDISQIHDGVQSFLSNLYGRASGSTPSKSN